jgi:ferredoxin
LGAEAEFRTMDLQHLAAEDLSVVEGSVMVKDETICIRCGLCAERCPAHTITMEAFEVFDAAQLVQIERIALRP